MTSFEAYLPYLLPPLLGAFIGYVTNAIAIRMLFRPLVPWRVLGVRVPLTPKSALETGLFPFKNFIYVLGREGEEIAGNGKSDLRGPYPYLQV